MTPQLPSNQCHFQFSCSFKQIEKLFECYLYFSHCIFWGVKDKIVLFWAADNLWKISPFWALKKWEEQTLGLWCIVITLGERKVTDKRQTWVWLGMGQRTMSFPWENKMCEMDKACSSNERERQWEGKRETESDKTWKKCSKSLSNICNPELMTVGDNQKKQEQNKTKYEGQLSFSLRKME